MFTSLRRGYNDYMAPYEFIEHTADIGIRVTAESLGDLFADAARGMFAIIFDETPGGWPESHIVELEAPDTETLLADWLAELLYLLEVKNFFTTGPQMEMIGEKMLRAGVEGVRLKGVIHGTEIKAVTQHLLSIDRTESGYETTVYFDI